MRKYSILLVILVAVFAKAQEKTERDTVVSVNDVENVLITEMNGGVKVKIKGTGENKDYVYFYKQEPKKDAKIKVTKDWELRLPFTKSDTADVRNRHKRNKWSIVSGSFYFGFNNTVDETINERTTASMEIAWDRILGIQYKPYAKGPSVSLGLGVGWKNIGFKDCNLYFGGNRDGVYVGQYEGDEIPKRSRLKVFSLRVPLMVSQKFGDGFRISAGAVMNVNTHASVKDEYLCDYVRVEESFSGVPVKKVTWDIMGTLNWQCLGLYAKYTPQTLFEAGKGPQFKMFTLGFGIFM